MLDVEALSEMMAGIISEEVGKAVAPLNAKIAELEARPIAEPVDVVRLVQEEVAKIPPPENGKDADPEHVASLVAETVERAVAALPAPQDGKSIGIEDVAPLIEAEVAKAVAQIPVPENGKDGRDGADGNDGRDGCGIADLLRDHEGNLVASFEDGRLKNLGPIQGKDGKDGRDGIELDSFEAIVLDDDRTIELKFVSGDTERVASFKWPQPLDCGVYKVGEQYQRGDIVTWGGSLWLAQRDTDAKPDTPDSGWRLAVKKGRDGKDGKNG